MEYWVSQKKKVNNGCLQILLWTIIEHHWNLTLCVFCLQELFVCFLTLACKSDSRFKCGVLYCDSRQFVPTRNQCHLKTVGVLWSNTGKSIAALCSRKLDHTSVEQSGSVQHFSRCVQWEQFHYKPLTNLHVHPFISFLSLLILNSWFLKTCSSVKVDSLRHY